MKSISEHMPTDGSVQPTAPPLMRDRRGRRRSPASRVFRPNVPPPNKGAKLPAEIVGREDIERLMEGVRSATPLLDGRDRAILWLLYRGDLNSTQIAGLALRHYDPAGARLTVPGNSRSADKRIRLDNSSCELLDEWLDLRRGLRTGAMTPLFCTTDGETARERPVDPKLIRSMVQRRALRAGIERRVTPKGLQLSGREHAQGRGSRDGYVDEDTLHARFPEAYSRWRDGLELYQTNPARHASHIGLACREAMMLFARDLAARSDLTLDVSPSRTVDRIRAVLRAQSGGASDTVVAFAEALLVYWGTVNDLAQRQVHGRERDDWLVRADARRLLHQTLLVMYELDCVTAHQLPTR